jgi:hypothetical protein
MTQWKTIPILKVFCSGEYEALARRYPPAKLQEHLPATRLYRRVGAIAATRASPIRAPAEQIGKHDVRPALCSLHEGDFGPGGLAAPLDVLWELVAAYCLGEVDHAGRCGPTYPPLST